MSQSALSIAKTGLDAQKTRTDVIANNLANANTNGFKKESPTFMELMYQAVRQSGGVSTSGNELPSGIVLGTGVRLVGIAKSFQPGSPVQTDEQYDMFINGRGFFQVLQDDGTTGYTRNGRFHTNSTGILVDSEGRQLQPTITIPANVAMGGVSIGRDGTVEVTIAGQVGQQTNVGTIQLADFMSPSALEPIGDSLYLQTAASGSPVVGNPALNGMGSIQQLALEGSNVNVVEELVNLIDGQRTYEMNAKVLEAVGDMLQTIANTA